jgi:hypothetical protein
MSQNFYKARLNEMFHGCVFCIYKKMDIRLNRFETQKIKQYKKI